MATLKIPCIKQKLCKRLLLSVCGVARKLKSNWVDDIVSFSTGISKLIYYSFRARTDISLSLLEGGMWLYRTSKLHINVDTHIHTLMYLQQLSVCHFQTKSQWAQNWARASENLMHENRMHRIQWHTMAGGGIYVHYENYCCKVLSAHI